jgi:hypothetical protein
MANAKRSKPFVESPAITSNILACYHRANSWDLTDGLSWYATARDTAVRMATRYSITPDQASGVISALSPGLRWEINIEHAETLIREWRARTPRKRISTVGTYGRRNIDKSLAILRGSKPLDILGGAKVRAFYLCITEPEHATAVCVDRHAKCLALGVKSSENSVVRSAEYEYLAEHYRIAAKSLKLLPNQVQSVSWTVWRRLDGILNQSDMLDSFGI